MSGFILALIAGAVVGLTLGALGGGGGVLAVPVLVYVLDFAPAAAATASLVIVVVSSAAGLVASAAQVRWKAGLLFTAAGLLPAAAFGAAATVLPETVLTFAFSGLVAIVAVSMLRPSRPATPRGQGRLTTAAAAGAGLGTLTGLFGVGGGFLAVPAFVTLLGYEMQAATATSLLTITGNSLSALIARGAALHGGEWALVAPFSAAAVLGVWDGRRLAAKLPGTVLQRCFAVVLLLVAASMLLDALI